MGQCRILVGVLLVVASASFAEDSGSLPHGTIPGGRGRAETAPRKLRVSIGPTSADPLPERVSTPLTMAEREQIQSTANAIASYHGRQRNLLFRAVTFDVTVRDGRITALRVRTSLVDEQGTSRGSLDVTGDISGTLWVER